MNKPASPTLPATVRQTAKSLLLDPELFGQAQRAAKALAFSPLTPAHIRSGGSEVAIANAILILELAHRMGESPLAVAQSVFFVNGTAGWKASYMISRANRSGVFHGPIRWRVEGEGDSLRVVAYAKLAETGDTVEADASMEMAKAENWTKNSKYRSMPKQMLQYRSAVFLIRLYAPEVMLGYQTVEEVEDTAAAHGAPLDVTPPTVAAEPERAAEPDAVEDAETIPDAEPEPEPNPEPERKAEPKPEPERAAEPKTEGKPGAGEKVHPRAISDAKAIAEELLAAKSIEDVDTTLEMWGTVREEIRDKYPDLHDRVIGLAERDARKRFGKEWKPVPSASQELSASIPDSPESDDPPPAPAMPDGVRNNLRRLWTMLKEATDTGEIESAMDLYADDLSMVREIAHDEGVPETERAPYLKAITAVEDYEEAARARVGGDG